MKLHRKPIRLAIGALTGVGVFISSVVMIMALRTDLAGGGGVIKSPGRHPSRSGAFSVLVSISDCGIVKYEVTNVTTGRKLVSADAGSTYQRWFFVWDDSDNLWVHSSDLGGTVWVRGTDGAFREESPFSPERLKTMPPEYRAGLPRSLKRDLGDAYRKGDITGF